MAITPITPGDELPDNAMMAVPREQLIEIGNAIREKRGTVADITIPDMPLEISLISGGTGPARADCGFFTVSDAIRVQSYEVSHNLGVVPKLIAVWTEDTILGGPMTQGQLGGLVMFAGTGFTSDTGIDYYAVTVYHTGTNGAVNRVTIPKTTMNSVVIPGNTETSFIAPHYNPNARYYPNVLYRWAALWWPDQI